MLLPLQIMQHARFHKEATATVLLNRSSQKYPPKLGRYVGQVPASAPVQGQLLGAGRPANRARIQLICSLTDSPIAALALTPGYLTKST
jgi:hypothetical protein